MASSSVPTAETETRLPREQQGYPAEAEKFPLSPSCDGPHTLHNCEQATSGWLDGNYLSLNHKRADVFTGSDSSFISVYVFMTVVWVELHTDSRELLRQLFSEELRSDRPPIGWSEL